MKKVILCSLTALAAMSVQAQTVLEDQRFDYNWSIGLDGGMATPLAKYHPFLGDMRGTVGLHIQKQVSPVTTIGVEGLWGVNTSSWYGERRSVAFDNSYVGAYGAFNLMNLFEGFRCEGRVFELELALGAGWGHDYANNGANKDRNKPDYNYFSTKIGLNFNFNVNEHITLSLKPSVMWNMTGSYYSEELEVSDASAAYSRKLGIFNLVGGFTYHFGPRFKCVDTGNRGEIDALNAQINKLRGDIDACAATGAALAARQTALRSELDACNSRRTDVAATLNANIQNVRYIFFNMSSSEILPRQKPEVEMLANQLVKDKNAKVVIKGYASKDGNADFNRRLAAARAESVKKALVKKYGISAERIEARGEGIGSMFSENDWNRVAICTMQ